MNIYILIRKMRSKNVDIEYFFNRELVYIKVEDFKEFEKHFSKPIKIFSKLNYRSKHFFKHIHCIKNDELVQFHVDYGNLYKNLFLAIPHFFLDVIPYFLYHLIRLKRVYDFRTLKEIKELKSKNISF